MPRLLLVALLAGLVSLPGTVAVALKVSVDGFDCVSLLPVGLTTTDAKPIRCSYRIDSHQYVPGQQIQVAVGGCQGVPVNSIVHYAIQIRRPMDEVALGSWTTYDDSMTTASCTSNGDTLIGRKQEEWPQFDKFEGIWTAPVNRGVGNVEIRFSFVDDAGDIWTEELPIIIVEKVT